MKRILAIFPALSVIFCALSLLLLQGASQSVAKIGHSAFQAESAISEQSWSTVADLVSKIKGFWKSAWVAQGLLAYLILAFLLLSVFAVVAQIIERKRSEKKTSADESL